MPSIGSSVSGLNAEVQKISLVPGIPGVASSVCGPELLGNQLMTTTRETSGAVNLPAGGAWVQLIAATAAASVWLQLLLGQTIAPAAVDGIGLAVGGAGAEVEFWSLNTLNVIAFTVPAGIILNSPFLLPVGSRISAQRKNGAAANTYLCFNAFE